MKKSIFAIALGSLLLLACTTVSAPEPILDGEPTGKVALETHLEGDLKFDYPVGWTVEEGDGSLFVASPERNAEIAEGGSTLSVCDVCIQWETSTLEEWLKKNVVDTTPPEEVEFNGMAANLIHSDFNGNEIILVEREGIVYSFEARKDSLTDQALTQTVMGSLRFEDGVASNE